MAFDGKKALALAKKFVLGHFVAGSNITMVEQSDGTMQINASGSVSANDDVARANIATHIADTDNPHEVSKADVGLGNADNTSDLNKPVSTATQTALTGKVDKVTGKSLILDTEITRLADVDNYDDSDVVEHIVDTDIHVTAENKATWNGKANGTHTHTKAQITDFPTIPTVTNDLTDELKDEYDTAYTHSQTAHAPATAEQNVQSDWEETDTSSDSYINNKPVIPTADGKTIVADDVTHMLTAQYIGENLLDNPDFAINQRGLSEYTGAVYTVDRWHKNYAGTVTANSDGSIALSADAYFKQTTESINHFIGKTVTASINIGGTIYSGSGIVPETTGSTVNFINNDIVAVYIQPINGILWFVIHGAVTFSWVKLEIGGAATPFVPPNPATELAKCQRYYQVRSTNDIAAVDLRPTMRTTPTDITAVTGGYAYVAEL